MIKCACCGKFISYEAIVNNETNFYYVPGSWYSSEVIEHTHKHCEANMKEARSKI